MKLLITLLTKQLHLGFMTPLSYKMELKEGKLSPLSRVTVQKTTNIYKN